MEWHMGVKRILNKRLTQINASETKGMHLRDKDMAEHKKKRKRS